MPSFSHLRTASYKAHTTLPLPRDDLWKLFSQKKQQKMWLFPKSPLLITFGHPQEPKHVSLSLSSQGFHTHLQGAYLENRHHHTLEFQGRLQDGRNGCLEHTWNLSLTENSPSPTRSRKQLSHTTLSLSLTTTTIGGRIAHLPPHTTHTFWQNLLKNLLQHMETTAKNEIQIQKTSSRLHRFFHTHPRFVFISLILSLLIALFLLA